VLLLYSISLFPSLPPPSFFFASGVLGLAENPHVSLPRICCGVKSSCKPSTAQLCGPQPLIIGRCSYQQPLSKAGTAAYPLMSCGGRVLRVKPLSSAASFANFAPQSLHHLLALIIEGFRYRQGCGTPQSPKLLLCPRGRIALE
jgi:hypothetical protein